MRRVMPRETVAHYWANQVQDHARDPGHNFFFTGSTLWSYGSHFAIAHILNHDKHPAALQGRILWNDESRSNTTSKHQSIAWRALSRQQMQTAIHLPELDENITRDIDRALQEKRLPDAAVKLTRVIQSLIASTIGKKHGGGPLSNLLFNARKYETSAKLFYAACGKKYPLIDIPLASDFPADKSTRAEFVAKFSRAIVQDDYASALKTASGYLSSSVNANLCGFEYTDPASNLRVVSGSYDVAMQGLRACDQADKHYAVLHSGKKSAAVAKLRKQLTPLADSFKLEQEKADRADSLARLQRFATMFYKHMRTFKVGKDKNPLTRFHSLPGYSADAHYKLQALGITSDSTIGVAVNRCKRIEANHTIDRYAQSIQSTIKSGNSYGSTWPDDAARSFKSARQEIKHIEKIGGRYASFKLAQLTASGVTIEGLTNRVDEFQSLILAKHQKTINDWVSGVSNIKPSYTAGTYARIKGGIVETSRGASVPIEHACRLTRVYGRIVSAGGKDWADGQGPMIGHYRVNSIGADGSLVIGCHEFTPVEAKRLHDLLQSCQECADVLAAESTNV